MPKLSKLSQTLAANLRFFMDRDGCAYRNANSLGNAAGVSPNTIRYYLNPFKRPQNATSKPVGFPTLDKLQVIADKLDCEVWELLHPDIARSLREREMYRRIEENYAKLSKKEKMANEMVAP